MPPDPPTRALSRSAQLRADFLEVDTRWLALSRVVLGLLVLAYVGSLASQDRPTAFFSDDGVVPLDVLRRLEPQHHFFTVFHFAHTPAQALALLGVEALLAVAVTVGFATRVTAPLAWLGLVSIHHRIPFVSNASMITMHLLGILWVFLPLSWHASVDAWIARHRGRMRAPYRVASLAPLGLRLQRFAIYYFNGP